MKDYMTPYIIIRYKYRVVQVLTDDTFNLGPNNRYCKIQVQPTHSIFYDASKTLVANIAFGHTYTKIPNNIIGSQINQNLFRVNWFKRATEPHKIALQASCLIFTDIFLLLLIRIQLLWDISFGNISIFFYLRVMYFRPRVRYSLRKVLKVIQPCWWRLE